MSRNGFTREQVLAIIARQATREARLAAADDVIVNDDVTLAALAQDVEILHQHYLALAGL
jgi:dephospho-CoA kinase